MRTLTLFLVLASCCAQECPDGFEMKDGLCLEVSEPADTGPSDADGDGHAAPEDCDDADPAVYPGAAELCDGADQDCDGVVDEGAPPRTWYQDADGDGFGDDGAVAEVCLAPDGYVVVGGDCDDADPTRGPPETWYVDADADGYGADASGVDACDPPEGKVSAGGDCDDDDPDAHPGATASGTPPRPPSRARPPMTRWRTRPTATMPTPR